MPGEGIDLHFRQVGDGGEAAAHVPVKGAVADGNFALITCSQQECAEFIGHGHEEEAACAGLNVFFGHVFRKLAENRRKGSLGSGDGVGNCDFVVFDAKVRGQRGGIVAAVLAGYRRRESDTDDIFRA